MVLRLCVTLSLFCMLWRYQKRSGWRRFGTIRLRREWSLSFSRAFNDWEVDLVERLLLTIQGKRVSADLEDRVLWKMTKDGIFSVKSLYSVVELGNIVLFLRSIIWSPYVPPKVGFFA